MIQYLSMCIDMHCILHQRHKGAHKQPAQPHCAVERGSVLLLDWEAVLSVLRMSFTRAAKRTLPQQKEAGSGAVN